MNSDKNFNEEPFTPEDAQMYPIIFDYSGIHFLIHVDLEGPEPGNWQEQGNGVYTNDIFTLSVKTEQLSNHSYEMDFDITNEKSTDFGLKKFEVRARIPMIDIHRIKSSAHSGLGNQYSRASYIWWLNAYSSSNCASPFIMGYNRSGSNRFFMGFMNQVFDTEIKHEKRMHLRDQQVSKCTDFVLTRPLKGYSIKSSRYHEKLYINAEDKHYFKVIDDYITYCDSFLDNPIPLPSAHNYDPVWCSWYAFRNDVTHDKIIPNIKPASELGIKTIIIDEGWFYDDDDEDWAKFAGDWIPHPNRFNDLAKTVRTIKDEGLKALLWIAPMHCGIKSKAYSKYKHLLAQHIEGNYAKWLCPRCKSSTDRAVEVIKMVINKYDLDGLKIDFLDMIKPVSCTSGSHRHDFDTVGEGMKYFFENTTRTVKELISDPIIEFRQDYANIFTRRFATAFRGNDAPFDFDHIRRETALLKPYSGNIPVHADYAYWHPSDTLENKAKMMACIMLGCVPTLSHELTTFSAEEALLVKNWLDFYNQWKCVLTTGEFIPLSFDQHYSIIELIGDNESVFGVFTPYFPGKLSLKNSSPDRIAILNGTNETEIFCELKNLKGEYILTVKDCLLNELFQETVNEQSPFIKISVPEGGIVILENKL